MSYRGSSVEARSIALIDLVREARPRLDASIKNHLLAFAVVVRGRDGYCITFSAGELLPEAGNRPVYVVTELGGVPLTEREALARLLVLEEGKPSRSLYGISSISVVDLSRAPAGRSRRL